MLVHVRIQPLKGAGSLESAPTEASVLNYSILRVRRPLPTCVWLVAGNEECADIGVVHVSKARKRRTSG
jgi:hypothetical protein